MADNKKRLEEMQRLLNEINKVYSSLNEKSPFGKDAKNLENSTNQVKQLEDALGGVNQRAKIFNSSLNDAFTSFKSIVQEIKKSDNGVKETVKSFNSFADVARKVRDHQEGISLLSVKQIQKEQEKLKSSKANLQSNVSLLEQQKAQIESNRKIGKEGKIQEKTLKSINEALQANKQVLTGVNTEYNLINSALKEQEKKEKKIQKNLGITGGVLKGISKIPILGDVFKADEAVQEMEKHLRGGGSAVGALGAGFKNIGSQIIDGVLNPANLILGAITGLIAAIVSVDKETGELAKSMGRSYSEALKTRKELTSIAEASGDAALNTKRLQETLTFVNKDLGTSGTLTEGNLKTFTKLREQAGMSNESIQSMNKYSMVMGGDLEKNTVNFQAQAKALSLSKGVSLNVKQLMGDMANVSNRTKLSIQGGADGLATAAVNAKLMGGNMADVEKIADSLLNFESSIEKELSAELLTGKNLNLEKARTAALNNDMATVAAEITREAGSAAEFGDMNRIQQEAIAAAMGMSADGMADMLYEQEALKSIGVDLTDEQQKAFELAKDKYGIEEASRMLKSKAQGEGIEGLVNEQSMQEEFNQSVDKMKEIFVDIAQNVIPAIQMALEPIMLVMSGISTVVGFVMDGFKAVYDMITSSTPAIIAFGVGLGTILTIQTALALQAKKGLLYRTGAAIIEKGQLAIMAVQIAMEKRKTAGKKKNVMLSIAGAAMEAFKSIALTPIVGPILGGIAAAAAVAYGYSLMKDGEIDPKKGPVISGEFGSVQLDEKDKAMYGADGKIKVGTDLMGGKNKSQSQSSGTSVNVDMSQTNALLQQLISAYSAGSVVNINMDGEKVADVLSKIPTVQ